MKIIKKLLLLCIILITLYGLSVFLAPAFAAKVDSLLGIPGFSENLRGGKEVYESTLTKDWNTTYQKTKSGVLDATDTVTSGVQSTKETIDSVRESAQEVTQTLSGAKESFMETKESLEQAGKAIQDLQEATENINILNQ